MDILRRLLPLHRLHLLTILAKLNDDRSERKKRLGLLVLDRVQFQLPLVPFQVVLKQKEVGLTFLIQRFERRLPQVGELIFVVFAQPL